MKINYLLPNRTRTRTRHDMVILCLDGGWVLK